MPLINNNLSPLAFYDSPAQQSYRLDYAYGQAWPLIGQTGSLIPFQISLPRSYNSVSKVYLMDFWTDDVVYDITTEFILSSDLKSLNVTGSECFVLTYTGILNNLTFVPEGLYYLKITFSNNKYEIVSDAISLVVSTDRYLQLTYSNSNNFYVKNGAVLFDDGFRFSLWLNTHVGKPEYVFDEEVTERMGYTFIETQVSSKSYNFAFVAPEYLCDALRIVRMCDKVSVRDGLNNFNCIKFETEVEWEEQGNLASVVCSFNTDNIVTNIGGLKQLSSDTSHYDFNDDFNNDFY